MSTRPALSRARRSRAAALGGAPPPSFLRAALPPCSYSQLLNVLLNGRKVDGAARLQTLLVLAVTALGVVVTCASPAAWYIRHRRATGCLRWGGRQGAACPAGDPRPPRGPESGEPAAALHDAQRTTVRSAGQTCTRAPAAPAAPARAGCCCSPASAS